MLDTGLRTEYHFTRTPNHQLWNCVKGRKGVPLTARGMKGIAPVIATVEVVSFYLGRNPRIFIKKLYDRVRYYCDQKTAISSSLNPKKRLLMIQVTPAKEGNYVKNYWHKY